jgi:CubicO group peptidase (beta-lactamase class C family)
MTPTLLIRLVLRFAGPPALTLVLFSLVVATSSAQSQPEAQGQSEGTGRLPSLEFAVAEARELPRLHSLLVEWQGDVLVEEYFNGTRASQLANMKSASKSVISALVGIALDRGFLQSVRQTIGSFFPDLLGGDQNGPKRAITLENLLTMRSGLETTSNRNYGSWVLSSNWVVYALNQPLVRPPGTRMDYSTGNTHLLSAILTRATGTTTWQFAQDYLADPLGFSLARWPQDPQGIYFGGNDMTMTPRQMMAFGKLYLHGGRTDDRQVIPREWVERSLVARTPSPRERGRFYGYGWWIREMAGHATYYAWGYGGQFIFLVPDLDLAIVTTSSSNPGEGRRAHLGRIYALVEEHIVGPVEALQSGTSNQALIEGERVLVRGVQEAVLR